MCQFGRALRGLGTVLAACLFCGCVDQRANLLSGANSVSQDLGNPTDEMPVVRAQRPETPRGVVTPAANLVQQPSERSFRINVRAWVNGKPIYDNEVMHNLARHLPDLARLSDAQRSERLAEIFQQELEGLIERELLYQDAVSKLQKLNPRGLEKLRAAAYQEFERQLQEIRKRSKLTDDELKQKLREQGLTLETMKRQTERSFIAMEYLRNRLFPLVNSGCGHQEIREYYETHLNEFQKVDSVKWQDLFVAIGPKHPTQAEARKTAELLIERLRAGEKFENLLEFDDGTSRYNQGEGIGQRRGEIKPPELEEHLFRMKDGDIGPAVEMETGVHVFRLVKRDYAGQLPFDDKVQTIIRNKLRNDIGSREAKRIVRDLKSRAIIEIDQENPSW